MEQKQQLSVPLLTGIESSMKLSMNIAIMRCVIDYKYVRLGYFQLEQTIIYCSILVVCQLCLKYACLFMFALGNDLPAQVGVPITRLPVQWSITRLPVQCSITRLPASAQSHGYLFSAQSHGYLSSAQSHGYLSSANCHVDGRWVLKITGFALQAFRKENCGDEVSEHQWRWYIHSPRGYVLPVVCLSVFCLIATLFTKILIALLWEFYQRCNCMYIVQKVLIKYGNSSASTFMNISKNSSTLQDKAFFHSLAHISRKNW